MSLLVMIVVFALAVLAAYGALGWFTFYKYLRVRHRLREQAPRGAAEAPRVTVQIPIFNERLVIERALRAAAALDYSRDRLQIQVIDDSDDATTATAERLVARYRSRGLDIGLIHRNHRAGFKAGALAAALRQASGEYIAVFDADFTPAPDFLRRTVACLVADPSLGLVQARWTHRNSDASLLTAAQSISIDRHFAIDQTVRFGADYFPKFNGSAGVWRRSCIDDAGGWRGETLCEDLCLSTRAFLRGWRFRLLPQVTAPAEIPDSICGFKHQQARWAQGSTQCLLAYGRDILTAREQPLLGRLYALLIMSGYVTALMPILMLLCLVPLVLLGWKSPPTLSLLLLAAASQPVLYAVAQRDLYPQWRRRLIHLGTLLIVSVGMSPAVTRGVLRALLGSRNPFERTVKGRDGWRVYRPAFDGLLAVEIFLAAYALAGLAACVVTGTLRPIPFFLACVAGYGYVSVKGLQEHGLARLRTAVRLGVAADRHRTPPMEGASPAAQADRGR